MTDAAVELSGLTKRYGASSALAGLNLAVPRGSTFGFLGPNGAGKTTTIRILLGLTRATGGSARVLGLDPAAQARDVHARVGYLPDVPAFYPWQRATEFVALAGRLSGLTGADLSRRVGAVVELAGLAGIRTKIGGFSRGMKQRLGIAQALVASPDLLILDEPTSALDPIGRHDVLATIENLKGHTTVFFSSHDLADVQRVCDRVAIIGKGRLVTEDTTDGIRATMRDASVLRVELATDADLPALVGNEPWLADAPTPEQPRCWLVRVNDLTAAQLRLPQLLADAGLGLARLETSEPTLEDAFVRLVGAR